MLKTGELLTASSDGIIFLWNPNNDFEEITHFKVHKTAIWNVC